MTVQHPWARHYQAVWHERAGDPRLPYWLRVAALAYGSHAANGHAPFKPGQVGLVLGRVDSTTGEVHPLEKGSVQRAIRAAAEYGWLAPQSGSTCLVVPSHAVVGGVGRADVKCPVHSRRRSRSTADKSARTPAPMIGGSALRAHLETGGSALSAYPVVHSVPTVNTAACIDATALYDSSLDVSVADAGREENAS